MLNKQWSEELPISNIKEIRAVAGGDANDAYQVETDEKTYFLLRQPNRPATFYQGEIAGLKAFEKAGITAPHVISNGQIDGDAYLLITFLEQGRGQQSDLGRLIATMHQHYSPNGKFGFDQPSTGSDLTYDNSWCDTWRELFVEQRMDVLANELLRKKLWHKKDGQQYQKVREIMNEELTRHSSKPSLLHGDLWGGNHMFLKDGTPALFDPDALYGDREFDLGASLVFNAFNDSFYQAYQESYPLEEGYEKRLNFYSLFLLMLHVNKFGRIYQGGVERTMNQILNDF
ncbi:fructosamine-3-kinase [Tetragenococcus halophilus subsp. flandriensis]|uniref:fructosamine kinase family protein n=1 Tax=Tetragenococcus halophilus TaxID=51669 RepID=UPI0023EA3E67|nr:fructosamine kinase family protein [Tetragenococcus halophilus]GMA06897.1 fructosamine-3-kinase [Tetragenococcus halophilus subsp. flandriensis]